MALPRTTKLLLLGGVGLGLVGLLVFNLRESRTIVVRATPVVTHVQPSATVVSALINPRYTGQNANGSWEVTAQTANQQATGTQRGANEGEVSLTQITAQWQPKAAPALALQAPAASFSPSTSILILPQGLSAHGVTGGYQVILSATTATANLQRNDLRLGGGVSVTLIPR
jgi:hypothetical protein